MFNQGHQQGQHGRVNGGPGGRTMPGMLYNFPHNTHQQQQQHTQHHANLQQDHAAHTTNGAVLGHHTSYSSGVLSNSTPNFTPSALQNGHTGATTRGGQAQQISEHWADQLKLHKEAEKAHSSMVEGGAPHHFARLKAAENKTTAQPQADTEGEPQDDEFKDLGRMADQFSEKRRQEWKTLDLSGQGLRVLTMPVFNYDFLRTLYLSPNKLKELPAAIGRLGNLIHLDLSFNQLTSLPVELSMCVNLEQLYLFDNRIQNLPVELGTLFKLEMLGIEGNPIDEEVKQMIMERGTKVLISHLRETAPSKTIHSQSLPSTA
jgi:CCR4-NOT transcription complex subunit 6